MWNKPRRGTGGRYLNRVVRLAQDRPSDAPQASVPPIIARRVLALIVIKTAKPKPDDKVKSKRFIKSGRELGCDDNERFQDAFLRDGHTRQCVGFTLIHLLVLAAIHPPTTRRQGNATV